MLVGKGFKTTTGFIRLFFHTDPSRLDILLIVLGLIFAIAAGIPFPLLGIVFGDLVDDLNSTTCGSHDSNSGLGSAVTTKVLYMVYITIFNFVTIYIHTGCWSLVGERLVRRLRDQYFRSLLKQEIAFFDTLPPGEISSRLSDDLDCIQTGTSEKVGICISSVSYFVAAYVVAFIKDAKLAGILVSLVPTYILMGFGGSYLIKKRSGRLASHISAAISIASDSLSNLRIVHAFGAQPRLELAFTDHLNHGKIHGLKKSIAAAVQLGLLYFISFSANALAFWQGSREIAEALESSRSGTSVGAVYTVIFLLIDVSYIISQVAPFMLIFANASKSAENLYQTIDRESAIDGTSKSSGKRIDSIKNGIELRDVSFAYASRPEAVVLQGVSIMMPANKHTAIVGLSGSGKSTIATLLGRLYDPTSGLLLLDGIDLREYNVRDLRSRIGLIEQDATLFNRSILENIASGLVSSHDPDHERLRPSLLGPALSDLVTKLRESPNRDEVIASQSTEVKEIVRLVETAATVADAARFIKRFKDGYATSVGAAGSQMSGGQKQRLALARALVKEPQILILDESTASLDSQSERKIRKAVAQVTKDRTVISIAHRLSTIQFADNIIVMRDGELVEQGSHTELIELDGSYASMVRAQTLDSLDSSESTVNSVRTSIDDSSPEREKLLETASAKLENASSSVHPQQGQHFRERPASVKNRSLGSTFKGIGLMVRPQLLFIVIGLSASTIVGGSYSGEAAVFGHTIEGLSSCRAADAVRASGSLFGLLFFILAVTEFLANVVGGSCFGWVAEKLLFRVRIGALRSLLFQNVEWHESDDRNPATLLSRFTSDTSALGSLAGTTVNIVFSIIVNLIAGIVLSHVVAWKIAIVLLAVVPVLLGSGFMRLRVLAQFQERHRKAFAHSVSITIEAVNAIKTIATFSLEEESIAYYRRSLMGPYQATLKAIAHGNFWLAMAFSVSTLVYAMAYWWGAKQIIEGTYTQTQFFIVLPAMLFSAQFSGQLFSLAPDISKSRVAAGNILDLLAIGPDVTITNAMEKASTLESHLKEKNPDPEAAIISGSKLSSPKASGSQRGMSLLFHNVSFTYASRPLSPVLTNVSLSVASGQFAAIVGPSGSGKSTILSLIERFYSHSSGSIFLDNIPLTGSTPSSFRDTIAIVPQDPGLFSGTVEFNIRLGAHPSSVTTQEEMETACRLANIHDTIMLLPQGYKTLCGPGGKAFSGGQRQRLSIARALLRKPRLLLLDETTSALDAESEGLLQEAMEGLVRKTGMTILAVAHRLRTIIGADVIFMVDNGIVVDQGRHYELCERSEAYRENVALQTLEG